MCHVFLNFHFHFIYQAKIIREGQSASGGSILFSILCCVAVFSDFSFWKKTTTDDAHDCTRPQFMNTIRNLSNMIEDLL